MSKKILTVLFLFSQITFASNTHTVKGGEAKDLYKSLEELVNLTCDEDGSCIFKTAAVSCTLTSDIYQCSLTTVIGGRPQWKILMEDEAEDVYDALVPFTVEMCQDEGAKCTVGVRSVECSKVDSWLWTNTYSCSVEQVD